MKSIEHLFTGITGDIYKYVRNLDDLQNKIVIDIPCGDGRMSAAFKELGATVQSYDLDDKDNDYIDHSHKFADMNERLPIKDNYADIESDMNIRNSSAKKKTTMQGGKTRKKREELSISATKSIKREEVEITIEFN